MTKTIDERIDRFLIGDIECSKEEIVTEENELDEAEMAASETGIKAGEYNNISTGLRRIQFRFERANTPQKYVDAFETVNRLVEKFPLKSKIIWQTVSQAYTIRFGSTGSVSSSGITTGGFSSGPQQEWDGKQSLAN